MAQPSKRRVNTAARRLAAAAKAMGLDLNNLNIPTPEQGLQAQYRSQLEAESTLYYVETKGAGFKDKDCKECGLPFSSTHLAVSYCSDVCRQRALAKIGIPWNPYGKSETQRWDGRVPKTLGPTALELAKKAIEDDD